MGQKKSNPNRIFFLTLYSLHGNNGKNTEKYFNNNLQFYHKAYIKKTIMASAKLINNKSMCEEEHLWDPTKNEVTTSIFCT